MQGGLEYTPAISCSMPSHRQMLEYAFRKEHTQVHGIISPNSQDSSFKPDKNNIRKKIQVDQSNLKHNDVKILTQKL